MVIIASRLQWLSPVLGIGSLLLFPLPGRTQSIQAALDGTGSNVTQAGENYTIEGGSRSSDGTNLFHSFSRFGLSPGEVANFLSTPAIQNILGRVTGGEASVINGLIRVTGSNANLFLLNPAGVIFGSSASLSVPASFTATTANGIGFGTGGWFNASGVNDYAALAGSPQNFAFTAPTGTIVNGGNLTVGQGHSITLLGGSVINTGTLTAPDGSITLAAVPGENLVRLSQANNLLSLEFSPLAAAAALPLPSPLSLPQLLTGGNVGSATGLTVNVDGSVSLTQSGMVVPTTAGTAIAAGTLSTTGTTGGAVTVVGDRVTVSNALINASGTSGGGTVRIGGDYQGQNTLPAATETTLTVDSTIRADALTSGNGGRVIIWSDGAANVHGTLSARGGAVSGNGGFIETSGKQFLTLTSIPDASALNGTAGTWLIDPTNITIVSTITGANQVSAATINSSLNAGTDVIITTNSGGTEAGDIVQEAGATITKSSTGSATLTLEAANDIVLNDRITNSIGSTIDGLTVNLIAGGDIISPDSISSSSPNYISATGSISLRAGGNITVNGVYSYRDSPTNTVTLTSTGGAIAVDGVYLSAGALTMTAPGDIAASYISSYSGEGRGANITLTSTNGAINIRNVSSGSESASGISSNGGAVTLSAAGNITIDSIDSSPQSSKSPGPGGNITLTSTGGAINGRQIDEPSFESDGGNISVTAAGDIALGVLDSSYEPLILSSYASYYVSPTYYVSPIVWNAGAINIKTPGNVLLSSILATSTTSTVSSSITGGTSSVTGGVGGAVTIEAGGFVRVVDTVSINSIPYSIATLGDLGGGAVSITHGGAGVTPFIVGDASVNGTAGAITTGTSTILPTQSFLQSTIIGNISILTPTLTSNCDLTACESEALPVVTPSISLNVSVLNAQDVLQQIQSATGVTPALIYLSFVPSDASIAAALQANESRLTSEISRFIGKSDDANLLAIAVPDSEFELLLVTSAGEPIRKRIPGLTRAKMIQVAQQFRNEVANPVKTRTRSYLPAAQQLYDWIIRPLEQELNSHKIQNLNFIAETGLRFIPFAALHDGQNFLIDKYSLGLMPSVSLVDTRYVDIRNSQVLVGGTSTFKELSPLPAVPTEIAAISQLWSSGSKTLQGDQFTLKELKSARQQHPFGIIHLATHGEFVASSLGESYIQLSDTRLRLNQLRLLGFSQPPVELMVLSACRMALGNDEAELGFAGLALQAGVKSVLASLWNVSDEGTVALMTAFYGALRQAPIKAEALRQAQLAMRNGQVSIRDGKVVYADATGEVAFDLPESLRTIDNRNLLHPYYWAAFTILGSPW